MTGHISILIINSTDKPAEHILLYFPSGQWTEWTLLEEILIIGEEAPVRDVQALVYVCALIQFI